MATITNMLTTVSNYQSKHYRQCWQGFRLKPATLSMTNHCSIPEQTCNEGYTATLGGASI